MTTNTIKIIITTLIRIISAVIFFILWYCYGEGDINYFWATLYFIVTQIVIPGAFWFGIKDEDESFDGELHVSVADDEGTIWRLSIPDEVAKEIEEKDILKIKVSK